MQLSTITCACTGQWLWCRGRRTWVHRSRRSHTPTKQWPHRQRSGLCFPDRSPCANPACPPALPSGLVAQRVLADLVHRQDPVGLVAPAWVGRIRQLQVSRRWQKRSIAVASGRTSADCLSYPVRFETALSFCCARVRTVCPLMTQSEHSPCAPELLQLTDFRAYGIATLARDASSSRWAKLTSFSLMEKPTNG